MRWIARALFAILFFGLGLGASKLWHIVFPENIADAFTLSNLITPFAYVVFVSSVILTIGCSYVLLLECFNIASGKKIRAAFLDRVKERFQDRAQIGFLAITATAALFAFFYYRDQTAFSLLQALEERDRATRAVYMTGGELSSSPTQNAPGSLANRPSAWAGKDLMKIFASEPERRNATGQAIELTDADYDRCDNTVQRQIRDWERQFFERVAGYDPGKWNDIPQLYALVWNSDHVTEAKSEFARALTMHAIDYLYIVHDAVIAKQKGYFSNDEYMMWGAYLDDLTPSPFFLLALADGQDYPYMMPSVRDEIRSYYLRADKKRLKCIVGVAYPQFLKSP